MKRNIKLFMCTHKTHSLLPPLAIAVQGGAALSTPINDTLPDIGPNGSISEKNPFYCELTVQYYAWKNEQADYYGFCHYRRFFGIGAQTKRPYLALGSLNFKKQKKLLGTPEELSRIVEECDLLLPRAEDMGCSTREQYIRAPHSYEEDLDLFLNLLKKKYPHLASHADAYLADSRQYFCNMFIMKRELFFDYCEHLFPLLEAFDEQKTTHGNFQSDRTDGYLAERFLGIYVAYLRERGIKIRECPRVDAFCSLKKRLLYHLFPPESRLRLLLKNIGTSPQ